MHIEKSILICLPITGLTFLYSKNVPMKGRGLGPWMPIFLKKPYGAYAYLRINNRIRRTEPVNMTFTAAAFGLVFRKQDLFGLLG